MTDDADDRGSCDHCPASAEGCEARQRFARERCCSRCSHVRAVMDPAVFLTALGRHTSRGMWLPPPVCALPVFPRWGPS